MKTATLTFFVVLFGGCGPQPTWRIDCVDVEIPQEQDVMYNLYEMEKGVKIAHRMFDDRYGSGTFCARAENVTIRLRTERWECLSGGVCEGNWNLLDGYVTLFSSGYLLLHEFVHVQETFELKPGTAWHENWDTNGTFHLSQQFASENRPWTYTQ